MKGFLIISMFCFLSFNSFSQRPLKELLPQKGKTADFFIPKGWLKLHSVFGDFNNDGLQDLAVVLIDSVNEKITADGNRSLLVLQGTKTGYILSDYCDSAFLCYGCGGVHGDPFESLKFENNKLILKHIVGSSYRVEFTTRFRYQDGEWSLTGETAKGCYLNARCDELKQFGGLYKYDKNYLTGQYQIKEINESSCKISKKQVGKTAKNALIKLNDYNISSVWNITP